MTIPLSHTSPFKGFRLAFEYDYTPGSSATDDDPGDFPGVETTSVWLEVPIGDPAKDEWTPVVDLLACGFFNEFSDILPDLESNLLDLPAPTLGDFNEPEPAPEVSPYFEPGDKA